MPQPGRHTARRGCDGPHQGGREREWGGRGNRGARPINVVRPSKAQGLQALHHKGRGGVEALPLLLSPTRHPPAHRSSLTHPVARRRNVVRRPCSSPEASEASEEPMGVRGWAGGKSAGHPVMGCRGVEAAATRPPPPRCSLLARTRPGTVAKHTRSTQMADGFDVLGPQRRRDQDGKMLITPAQQKVATV